MPRILLIGACAASLAAATSVWAAEDPAAAAAPPASPALAAQAPTPPAAAPVEAAPGADAAPDDLLEGQHGKGTAILTEQDLTAVNSGNTITAGVVGSGAISLQDAAFSGFAGVGNVMMNTGHNNNLQSTVSVTIVMPPAATGP